jgi:peptidoglycan hydrolase CwlO-like protein
MSYYRDKNYLENSLLFLNRTAADIQGSVEDHCVDNIYTAIKDAEEFIRTADREKKNLENQISELEDQVEELKLELDKYDELEVLRLKRLVGDLREEIYQLQNKLDEK